MISILNEFKAKKNYVVCIDSDGCAMDTMNIKHYKCFGPCMIKEWNLERWENYILERWNEMNLYSMTRGINRFKGLALALKEIDASYAPIIGVNEFVEWTMNTDELSNQAIKTMLDVNPIFKRALHWSEAVNAAITALPEVEIQPFPYVKEALTYIHQYADIVIVSSANPEAVKEEWEKFGLMEEVDCMCAQDVGSKAYCIGELLKKGYEKNHVLMCGDAPGDDMAAEKNGVLFYPILVGNEAESWKNIVSEGMKHFLEDNYLENYQKKVRDAFYANLGA